MIFNHSADGRKVRQFSLSNAFLAQFAGDQPAWGPLGYFTYKRTYARDLPEGGTEEFWQTCQRVVEGCFNIQKVHCHQMGLPWNEAKAQKSAQDMFTRMWQFKFTPPGRGLAVMGTDIVYQRGSASLQNCAFVSSEGIGDDFAAPFTFLMDMSMLGVGVGGDTRGVGKVKLTMPKTTTEPHVVQDSREGWVELLRLVLNSFVGKTAFPLVIDYSQVRGRGTPLKTFGGTASGPKPLHDMIENIVQLLLPSTAGVQFDVEAPEDFATIGKVHVTFEGVDSPYKIMSTQIVDIFNYVGKAVVAGGIRRTAEIMFGEPDDESFLTLKDTSALNELYARKGNLEACKDSLKARGLDITSRVERSKLTKMTEAESQVLANIANETDKLNTEIAAIDKAITKHPVNDRRWASNNSVFGYVGMDYTELARSMADNGEPGIVWLNNARKHGRMLDAPDNKDWRIAGTNPCGEQGLESFELCNLVETYPAHHDSYEDFERTLKTAYLYAKTVTLVPTHDLRANAVMTRNRRIGCSMSGIVQAMQKFGRREFLNWCDNGYGYVQKLDRIYSDWLGIPLSVKTTTVKPSGTVSLLCGATPGIHYPHSEYYIRHIRVSNNSPLCEAARKAGYNVFPDQYADDTAVVAFPIHEKLFVKGKAEVSLWEQFVNSADMQKYWSDNLVSATVTFSKKEIPDIKTCLESFETSMKGISLLPLLEEDHGYFAPPYCTITKEQYETMSANLKPMELNAGVHDTDEKFCEGDKCLLPSAR